jgi:hypothetical protein
VVLSHPAQNVVQHHYGFIDVRSLVQHDAFRTLPIAASLISARDDWERTS